MKINKKNYKHWIYVAQTTACMLLTLPVRLLPSTEKIIILYGHKLNGNLAAFFDHVNNNPIEGYKFYFLTMDPQYHSDISQNNKNILLTSRVKDMAVVAKSSVFITDHGPHILIPYMYLTHAYFIDVWHGVPFKGFTPENFKYIRKFKQVWVTSSSIKQVYMKKLGFNRSQLKVTGYSRIDALVNKTFNKQSIRSKYDISSKFKKVILLAPTWKQDDKGRSILPFGVSQREFFSGLNTSAKKVNSLIIFRTHLNSADNLDFSQYPYIRFMPYAKYPIAEEFLFLADVLITDWSSIAFDYLPLGRPTIFLDVKAPFKNDFTVDPSFRFGEVVSSYKSLLSAIELYAKEPGLFSQKYTTSMDATTEFIYGSTADGKVCERYIYNLMKLVSIEKL